MSGGQGHTPGIKLTGLQRTTLSDISHGSIRQVKFGYGAWRIMGGNPSVVGRLVSLGLAKWGAHQEGEIECLLTDAGRAAIAKATGAAS